MARNINGSDFGRQFNGIAGARSKVFDRLGTPRGIMQGLYPTMFHDVNFVVDDFLGPVINPALWAVDGDTGPTNFAILAGQFGGVISGDTALDDAEGISIRGSANWRGDNNCGMLVRWQLDVVTDLRMEIGFTDALSDYTLPAVNDIDTPTITNGAVTVAVLVIDTDQTLTTAAFLTDGDTTYASAKKNLGTWAPTAATWYTTVIQLTGNTAEIWVYDTNTQGQYTLVAGGTAATVAVNAVEGGTLVQPWVFFGNRAASAAKVPLIDLIAVWQDR